MKHWNNTTDYGTTFVNLINDETPHLKHPLQQISRLSHQKIYGSGIFQIYHGQQKPLSSFG